MKHKTKRHAIIIDLDMRFVDGSTVYEELSKIARSKGFKLKPFCELVLRRYVKEERASPKI